jgi:hypothetical protein
LGERVVQKIKVYSELEEDYSRYSSKLIITDEQIIDEIPNKLSVQYEQVEYLFNSLIFYHNHMLSCEAVEIEISSAKYPQTYKEVWKKIFSGGEGLFYSLEQIKSSRRPLSNIDKIQKEIIEIFCTQRHLLFPKTPDAALLNKFYNQTLTAKAFQVGFMTAYYHLNEKFHVIVTDFIEHINSFIEDNIEGFIYLMTDFRKGIVGELDPKKWPTIQNLFIRIYCEKAKNSSVIIPNYKEAAPDIILFTNLFNDIVNTLFVTEGVTNIKDNYDKIKPVIYYDKIEDTIERCENMINLTGLIKFDNYRELCIDSLEKDDLYQYIKIHTPT